jgi:phenylacetic acid degradation operon negative regulatory protein
VRARSALFTVFGDVVRPTGGEAWLPVISGCMATLGFSGQAVRTALHRMAAEGWVEPRREGRYAAYRLTARGVARLDEAAARIYRLRSLDWDGRWRLVLAPGLVAPPAVAELGWIGYGRLQPGVWVHPHPHPQAARALLRRQGVAATWVDEAAVVDGAALASSAWALEDLRARLLAFLDEWADVAVPPDGATALGLRLRLVHRWRSFLFLDPGLPVEVLPADWPGSAAARRFAEVYGAVRERSWAHVAALQAEVPGTAPLEPLADLRDPFARGLAAMQH